MRHLGGNPIKNLFKFRLSKDVTAHLCLLGCLLHKVRGALEVTSAWHLASPLWHLYHGCSVHCLTDTPTDMLEDSFTKIIIKKIQESLEKVRITTIIVSLCPRSELIYTTETKVLWHRTISKAIHFTRNHGKVCHSTVFIPWLQKKKKKGTNRSLWDRPKTESQITVKTEIVLRIIKQNREKGEVIIFPFWVSGKKIIRITTRTKFNSKLEFSRSYWGIFLFL